LSAWLAKRSIGLEMSGDGAQVRYPNERSNEPISEESLSIWSS